MFSLANSYSYVLSLCLVVIILWVFVIHFFIYLFVCVCVLFDLISRTLILIHFHSFIHCLFFLYERWKIVFLSSDLINIHHNHCNHLRSLSQFPDFTSQISMLHLEIRHLGTQELTMTESTFFFTSEKLLCALLSCQSMIFGFGRPGLGISWDLL